MKNTLKVFLAILMFTACQKSEELIGFENRITKIENENKELLDSLNVMNSKFIKPFRIFETIILSELDSSPNKIIADYEFLIQKYPNSYWNHQAKKRIENIEKRRKFWSKKEGWKLPQQQRKNNISEIIESTVISCPGC